MILKRIFDLLLASIGTIILLIPMICITCMILLFMGRPVFFKQRRIGYNKTLFTLYKFRTMLEGNEPDKLRLTKLGIFLRKTSLDELPELFNVIKGEMSIVGPRPLLTEYLPLYTKEQMRRHEVQPGITGWAQICGRNEISWQKKFEMDVWYVDHISFVLDIKILWLTFWKVLKREGISQVGQATAEKFTGN
jgi:sugar transferase EpsL